MVPSCCIWTLINIDRYSTKFELFLDFIGLVAAAGAGASQVCCLTITSFVDDL